MIARRRVLPAAAGFIAAVAVVVGMSVIPTPAAQAVSIQGPEQSSFPPALAYSWANPLADPPGANDWKCQPSVERPRPVVLLHGTWENKYANFAMFAPELKRDGYCVFAPNYGKDITSVFGLHPSVYGTRDIGASARELARFVDRVLDATGAAQVDIVGHSQGGMMPRQYLKFEGGADANDPSRNKVRNLVSLGATHNGTTLSGLATLADLLGLTDHSHLLLGTAAQQQVRGSKFLTTLNAGGHTMPGVNYTVIATEYDEVTTPYDSTFFDAGPGATVTNVTLQDGCPVDLSDHLSMMYSPRALGHVRNGLAGSDAEPPCEANLPLV